MAHDKKVKMKVKVHFETHMDEPKEVSKLFNIPVRTISDWIAKGEWQMGYYLKGKQLAKVKEEITDQKVDEKLKNVKSELMDELKKDMIIQRQRGELDGMLEDEFIGEVSDSLIFQAMGEGFLDKELATTMLIARNIFHTNVALNPANPFNMSLAKDYMGMAIGFKKSRYGTEPTNIININNVGTINQQKMSEMSNEELQRIILEAAQIKE